MKKLLRIVAGIVVVLLVLFVVLELFLDKLVLRGVNSAAPAALGVPVSLQAASISLVRGQAALQGLHIGNPPGFKTDGLFDLGSVSVEIDNSSLLSDTLVIREIAIDGLVLTYEQGLRGNNLGALIEQLSAGADESEPGGEAKDEDKPDDQPAKKVVIEKLSITGSRMNVSLTGAAALTGGGAIPVPLPPITLTDLGKEQEGITLVEAVRRVLAEIAGAAGSAIAGAGPLLGDAGKALGEGAVDAGKAVGGAVGGAVGDAGKAVGDALKTVNPFKK